MKSAVMIAMAIGALSVAPPALADDETCLEVACPIPAGPTAPTPPETPSQQDLPIQIAPHLGSSPAQLGIDRRPCVSRREYRSAKADTRADLETRWEVTNLGKRRQIPALGMTGIIYPRCGYTRDEAWYAVIYDRGQVAVTAQWREIGAVAHALI